MHLQRNYQKETNLICSQPILLLFLKWRTGLTIQPDMCRKHISNYKHEHVNHNLRTKLFLNHTMIPTLSFSCLRNSQEMEWEGMHWPLWMAVHSRSQLLVTRRSQSLLLVTPAKAVVHSRRSPLFWFEDFGDFGSNSWINGLGFWRF